MLVARTETPFPADVVLFHPQDTTVVIVGTYLLDETTRERRGKICSYKINGKRLVSLQDIDSDAVLDMKWYGTNLYVAHATGSISIFASTQDPPLVLSLISNHVLVSRNVLVTSLAVSNRGILTSHSDGTAGFWTGDLQSRYRLEVSDLEVWTAVFGQEGGDMAYTGSDDALFASWDLRTGKSVVMNKRTHGAGVTAVLEVGGYLMTGSYDDRLRVFDPRETRKALSETDLGGGVWRMTPTRRKREGEGEGGVELLVCCMYEGAKVVSLHGGTPSVDIVKEWKQHESMVYGADVCDAYNGTCSFYDKLVCIWK